MDRKSEWWVVKIIQSVASKGVFKTSMDPKVFDTALSVCKQNPNLVLKQHSFQRCTHSDKECLIVKINDTYEEERPKCVSSVCKSFQLINNDQAILFVEQEKRLHNSGLGCELRYQQTYVLERLELIDKKSNVHWLFDIKKYSDDLVFYNVYIKSLNRNDLSDDVINKLTTLLSN